MTRLAEVPTVSVLMGVHNCAETLPAAIDSLLNQTFGDWELIMCDDGSTDSTRAVAQRYADADPRIHLLVNEQNLTLAPTLNRCLAHARGEFIARMDGDDLSEPERLQTQLDHLRRHPELALVSSAMTLFDDQGVWGTVRPKQHPEPRDLVQGTPFPHAPVMVRAAVLTSLGGYSESPAHQRVEDYELWTRLMLAGHIGENLQTPLYGMRNDRDAAARRTRRARRNEAGLVYDIAKRLGLGLHGMARAGRPLVVGMIPPRLYRLVYRLRHRGCSGERGR